MVEKEMEDLLWNHPEKFFGERLKQFRRQPRSAVGRADLVFEDRLGRLWILELKKGTLGRDAVGQLVDYFGMVKNEFPTKPVELIVVANRIPQERRLACNHYDIDCYEISENKFHDVASEVGYQFDSEKALPEPARPISSSEVSSRSARDYTYSTRSLSTLPPIDASYDRQRLEALIRNFESVVRRRIDLSLAVNLRKDLLEREFPMIRRETILQLARWCKTNNPLYWDGMEIARKISVLLFGKILDRNELQT